MFRTVIRTVFTYCSKVTEPIPCVIVFYFFNSFRNVEKISTVGRIESSCHQTVYYTRNENRAEDGHKHNHPGTRFTLRFEILSESKRFRSRAFFRRKYS